MIMDSSEFHVLIPARYQSVRLPGKVLRPIAGRPMLAHVHDAARAAGATNVWVATDDRRVAEACGEFGATAVMTGQHESGSDRIAEAAARLGLPDEAIVVNLQGDEPLMPPAAIREVAMQLAGSDDGMATLCTPIRSADDLFNPNVVKVVMDERGRALYFSRAPIPWDRDRFGATPEVLGEAGQWYRHVGLYAYRLGFLQRLTAAPVCMLERVERLEQLRAMFLGERIGVHVHPEPIPAGVDVEDDIARVEQALTSRGRVRRVLFVCMGNICRSPTAQGVAESLIAERGLQGRLVVDSAGTHASHVGEAPDPRAVKAAARRRLDLTRQRARRVAASDFHEFDHIVAMDERNYQALLAARPHDARAQVSKMMQFSTLGVADDVPDPYYGGAHGFEQVLDLLENAMAGFLDRIMADDNQGAHDHAASD